MKWQRKGKPRKRTTLRVKMGTKAKMLLRKLMIRLAKTVTTRTMTMTTKALLSASVFRLLKTKI